MHILITGSFGFVGTNLSRALSSEKKHRLLALDLKEPAGHIYDAFYSWDDLSSLESTPVDAIIHLAGKAHDTRNTAAEQEYFDVNLGLTEKIFDFFLQSNATKFIFFSSVKAAADTVRGESLTETAPASPGTPYGHSKLAAENHILNTFKVWVKTHHSSPRSEAEIPIYREVTNKSLFILRPAMIHGPGNKGNLNLLYKVVSSGIPWPLGAFDNRRSFTSIDNLNFILRQLLEKEIEPGIYNVADDEALSTNRLIGLIAGSKGMKARIWNIPRGWISFAARMGDTLHLPLNSERLKKLTESYVVSNAKLKKALGIEQMPVSTEEGMIKTLKSFTNI